MEELSLHILDIAQNSIAAGASRLTLQLDETGESITLTVTDNGCGMSPELLSQVCDPFSTTRTTRKVGLGLPLLRMTAEQTGGTLSIESTPGCGTRLTARFNARHIDCPPVGDLGSTIALLIQGAPTLSLQFLHTLGTDSFQLDTDELKAQLGTDISLAEPEVVLWLRDYIREQEQTLKRHE